MTSDRPALVAERDIDWQREVWRETVRTVVVTESQAFFGQVFGIVVIGLAASLLPDSRAFMLPIVMRVLAAMATKLSWINVRRKVDRGEDLAPSLRLLALILFFGGASWASLLVPLLDRTYVHPAQVVIGGGVLVGVALIMTMISPLRGPMYAYAAGFVTMLAIGLSTLSPEGAAGYGIAYAAVLLAILIYATASARQREFAADMLVANQRLAEELEEALAHAEFIAAHDPLTGLFNRRALFEGGLLELASNDRAHILLLDLDNFKHINDAYGHDRGDHVLIAAANMMRDALRLHGGAGNCAVRLGGEEFAIFLDEPYNSKAMVFAEDLREGMALLHGALDLPAGATGASIGLSHHDRGDTVTASLRRADAAMYDAKSQGRNRVRSGDR